MTYDTFSELVDTHQACTPGPIVVPVHRRVSADLLTPVAAYLRLRQRSPYSFLFESVEGGEKLGRYSFIGIHPEHVLKGYGDQVTLEIHDEGGKVKRIEPGNDLLPEGDIFDALQHMLDRITTVPVPDLPRLTAGGVGYLGYDAVRLLEHLPDMPTDDLQLPDAVWGFYDLIVAFDHVRHQVVLIANTGIYADTDVEEAYQRAHARLDRLEAQLREPLRAHPEAVTLESSQMASNMSQSAFEEAVEQAKEHIYEGDIFQVVLSQRFETSFSGDPFNLYRALRQVNPSPYLFYLDLGDFSIAGSSPEVLVRCEEGRAEVLPIAGTRPRGRTPEEDKALAAELLDDPKERAEHVMLVDLGRNDLGRVCRFDTVGVDRYATIERYSHVMHIVSSVTGELEPQHTPTDLLKACFPAGTVSGAPKVRAMEIIDRLEPTKRGVYAGAVGYIDHSGTLDTCIAIRTMVIKSDTVYVQAGAGIVADSDPQREFEETRNKAEALRQAMRTAADDLL